MKKRKKNPVFILLFFAALAVFLFAAINIGMLSFRYYKEDASYRSLKRYAAQDAPQPENADEETPFVSPVDFASLKEINPDTIAWIYFENTDINYPVVQGEDNEFYLHHDFYKEESSSGCIFMDTQSAPDFLSDNSFLYGHNMKDKSMFARLNQFADESFYQENKTFTVYTPTQTRQYEIYSCYPAELGLDSFDCQFEQKEDYAAWQKTVTERSLYDTGVSPDPSEPTVTLMTCTPKGRNYRFLVHARLME